MQASTAIIGNPTFNNSDSGGSREVFTVVDCPSENKENKENNSPAPQPAPRKYANMPGMSDDEASGGNFSQTTDPTGTLPKDAADGKLFVSI